jgi:hypothetical protein
VVLAGILLVKRKILSWRPETDPSSKHSPMIRFVSYLPNINLPLSLSLSLEAEIEVHQIPKHSSPPPYAHCAKKLLHDMT